MKFLQIIVLLGLCSFYLCPVKAQTARPVDQSMSYDSISIPPLSMMIDSAFAHDAMLRYYEQGLEAKEISLRIEGKKWINNFGVQSSVRYGTFDNFSTNSAAGQTSALLSTRTSQINYGIGGYLNLPVADFFNRKSNLQLSKTQVEQARQMAEVQRDQVRLDVIKQYNNLILKLTLLKIKAKNLESSRMNMIMAEKEFQNGNINLGAYSGISETFGNTEVNFEEAKTDFKNAYMILEELVGFKFNIKIQ